MYSIIARAVGRFMADRMVFSRWLKVLEFWKILTNLLENAAEAAGPGGSVMALTSAADGQVSIEVHDSGPGLNEEARRSLFEPTISFKARGMGLGLSIARKNALRLGGDILLVAGELGGVAFRVVLPQAREQGAETKAKSAAAASRVAI
jgi:signal transduction histidine kinase